MVRTRFVVGVSLVLAASASFAQPLFETAVQAGNHTFYRDAHDEHAYHYAPTGLRLAEDRDGEPQFLFVKYTRAGEEDGERTEGGLLHTLLTWGLDGDALERAQAALRGVDSEARLIGPVSIEKGEVAVISAAAASDGGFVHQVIGTGVCSMLPGGRCALGMDLSAEGATLLWETFQKPTADVSARFLVTFRGLSPAFNARLKVHWDEVHKHQEFHHSGSVQYKFFEGKHSVDVVLDELRQQGAIEVEIEGEDTNTEALWRTAYDHLIGLMFQAHLPPGKGTRRAAESSGGSSATGSSGPATGGARARTPTGPPPRRALAPPRPRREHPLRGRGPRADRPRRERPSTERSATEDATPDSTREGLSGAGEGAGEGTGSTTVAGATADAVGATAERAARAAARAATRDAGGAESASRSGGGQAGEGREDGGEDGEGEDGEGREVGLPFKISAEVRYSYRREKRSGNYELDFRKRVFEHRTITMDHNLGGVIRGRSDVSRHLAVVNLDDPTFENRAVEILLDEENAEHFDRFINAVSVQLRRPHDDGTATEDDVVFTRESFARDGKRQRWIYPRLGDRPGAWLAFDYRVRWHFFGGAERVADWRSTESSVLTLVPPARYRTVRINADQEDLLTHGVVAVAVQLRNRLFGAQVTREVVIDVLSGAPLSAEQRYLHAPEHADYEARIIWTTRSGDEVVEPWSPRTSPLLFLRFPGERRGSALGGDR